MTTQEVQWVLDALPGNACVVDSSGVIRAVNERWRIFARDNGGEAEEGLDASYLASMADHNPVKLGLLAVLRGEKNEYRRVYPCHGPDQEQWFQVVIRPLAPGGALLVHLDVTDQHQRVTAIVEQAPFPIIELDSAGDAVYVSPAWLRVTGQAELEALDQGWLEAIRPDDRPRVEDGLRRGIATRSTCTIDVRLGSQAAGGWIRLACYPHVDSHDRLRRVVVSAVDVTADRRAHQRLSRLAHVDALTGLSNRAHFLTILTAALAALDRQSGTRGAIGVLFIDLDDFKAVNDTNGHAAGDEVIRVVGSRIADSLRTGDSAARFGGDEFLVMVTDAPDLAVMRELASRLRSQILQPIELAAGTGRVSVGASVGAVRIDRPAEAHEVVTAADRAMYRAKAMGGGGVFGIDLESSGDLVQRG